MRLAPGPKLPPGDGGTLHLTARPDRIPRRGATKGKRMWEKWLAISTSEIAGILVSLAIVYAAIILYVRLSGLRSFSKMAAPDFAMTVAVGSLFGSAVASPTPTVGATLVALFGLFGGQWLIAILRQRFHSFHTTIDNTPVLLMLGPEFLDANLKKVNVTREDVRAKLRERNVLKIEHVRAVVFETTGDVTVLASSDPSDTVDPVLLDGVAGEPSTRPAEPEDLVGQGNIA